MSGKFTLFVGPTTGSHIAKTWESNDEAWTLSLRNARDGYTLRVLDLDTVKGNVIESRKLISSKAKRQAFDDAMTERKREGIFADTRMTSAKLNRGLNRIAKRIDEENDKAKSKS